jgi:Uma2 family endonuclease
MDVSVKIPLAFHVTQDQFEQLALTNRDVAMERTAEGELIVMAPTGGNTGKRNARLTAILWVWNETQRLGEVFDSSTIFRLPNGASRSPDAAWVQIDRWNALALGDQERFPPICPDFVVELRSKTDTLSDMQDKMDEYMSNGAQLGWLIDPQARQVHLYRPGQSPEVLNAPNVLSGDPVLPGFQLEMQPFWR